MDFEASQKSATLAGMWSSFGFVPIEAWLDHRAHIAPTSSNNLLWAIAAIVFFFVPFFVFVIGLDTPSFGRLWFLEQEERAHYTIVAKRMFIWLVSAGATGVLWSLTLGFLVKQPN